MTIEKVTFVKGKVKTEKLIPPIMSKKNPSGSLNTDKKNYSESYPNLNVFCIHNRLDFVSRHTR